MINKILKKSSFEELAKNAIECGNDSITYSNLYEKSTILASYLQSKYDIGDRVLVYSQRSVNAIISFFGILQGGFVHIPLDEKTPKERFENIVRDCRPVAIICDTNTVENIDQNMRDSCEVISCVDGTINIEKVTPLKEILSNNGDFHIDNNISEEQTAYIIFTSGSSGLPKGVMISRKSIWNFTVKYADYMKYNVQTRMLGITSLSGDGSFIQYLCTLYRGGTVCIHQYETPNTLSKFLQDFKITDIDCSATIVKILASKFSFLKKYNVSGIKTISYGGDVLPRQYAREIKKIIPNVKFFNGYGPTECTVLSSIYEITDEDIYKDTDEDFPIGKPFKDVEMLALKDNKEPIGVDEEGELLVGGIQLMQGYWNDDNLNNKVLMNHPYKNGEKLYKTGDLVTIDKNGNYRFLRRISNMIKIRGYRVFISEVENVIKKNENIKDCIIVTKQDYMVGTDMKAFIVPNKDLSIDIDEIIVFLKKSIPEYMIPSEFKVIYDYPILPNGKIDRNRLAEY